MTKTEVRNKLLQGKTLDELFRFTEGQGCMIYKADGFSEDDVIYIPDIGLNEIDPDIPVKEDALEDALNCMYTGQDFIDLCRGERRLAEYLFSYVDWQHPSSALNADFSEFSDEEFMELCGHTYDELFR